MNGSSEKHPLPGSAHAHFGGAIPVAAAHPAEFFDVNVMLRRRPDGAPLPSPDELGAQPPLQREYVSRKEFEERHGADPDDVELVRGFAAHHNLHVTQVNLARRTVTLAGNASQFARGFSVTPVHFAWQGGTFRSHYGPVYIPAELREIVTAVIGLDNRPAAIRMASPHRFSWSPGQVWRSYATALDVTHRHVAEHTTRVAAEIGKKATSDPAVMHVAEQYQRWLRTASDSSANAASASMAWWRDVYPAAQTANERLLELARDYISDLTHATTEAQRLGALAALDALDIKTPPGIARLYNFPEEAIGTGQCIGIIELGGGYRQQDLLAYFAFLGIPMPAISDVSVSGGQNAPGLNEPFDGEVCLDIEVIGGAAPGARLVCYFAPLTAKGFIEAVHTAIHDRENQPSVLSASWDLSEAFWLETPMFLEAFEEVLREAAILGVTVCCSAGDYGSSSEFLDGRAWVDYPASSPYSLGCGGTTLVSRGDTILLETVWNTAAQFFQATGGGVSQAFPLPDWQVGADVPQSVNPGGGKGRGVPDVAANADPTTGYLIQVDGRTTVICGTSAGAPLWAALIARINQSLGKPVGYINPYLYQSVEHDQAFNDIVVGGNGVYVARKGWDACTGWGSPNGRGLRDALGATA